MSHALYLTALWFLSLFVAYKMGGANEQIRVQRVLRSALDGRGLQTRSGRAPGAPRSSSIGRDPQAAPLYEEGRADDGVPSRDHPPSRSVLYDGEDEPPPALSVVPEPPGLRVVKW